MKIVPTVAAVGLLFAVVAPSLKAIDMSRLVTAFNVDHIFSRAYIVVAPTIDMLLENPLGRGLGHATHGIPVILLYLVALYKPGLIDGDLGHAAVDFGIIGMVTYIIMMVRGVLDSVLWTRELRGTEGETIGVTSAALFTICLLNFIPGSPFLHVPTGAIVWYLIGGLNRVYDDRMAERKARPDMGIRAGNAPLGTARPPMLPTQRTIGEVGLRRGVKPFPKTGKPKAFLYD